MVVRLRSVRFLAKSYGQLILNGGDKSGARYTKEGYEQGYGLICIELTVM